MKLSTLSSVVLATALCGCSFVQYQHPNTSDAAKLKFVNKTSGFVVVEGFADSKTCSGLMNLSEISRRWVVLGLVDAKSEEVTIRPNEELSFVFRYRDGPMSCSIIGTFLPRPQGRYTAVFSGDQQYCYVKMTSLEDGKEVREESFRGRKPIKQDFSTDTPGCESEKS